MHITAGTCSTTRKSILLCKVKSTIERQSRICPPSAFVYPCLWPSLAKYVTKGTRWREILILILRLATFCVTWVDVNSSVHCNDAVASHCSFFNYHKYLSRRQSVIGIHAQWPLGWVTLSKNWGWQMVLNWWINNGTTIKNFNDWLLCSYIITLLKSSNISIIKITLPKALTMLKICHFT